MMTRSTISQAERAVYLGSLGIVAVIGGLSWLLPGEVGARVARVGFGFFAFWYLTLILFSTPWARFHKGRRLARLIEVREALGLSTTFHVAGHVAAMGLFEPLYLIDYTNAEDLPGIISSLIVAVLAVTSFPGMKQRMRSRTWKRVHRWIYLAWALIVLVVITSRPWTAIPHMIVVLVLIGYRVALWWARRKKGHRLPWVDRLNYLAMTLVFLVAAGLGINQVLLEERGIGIGLFQSIGL